MKISIVFLLFFQIIFTTAAQETIVDSPIINPREWNNTKITKGVKRLAFQNQDIFDSKQNINSLIIDLKKGLYKTDIVYLDSGRELLSELVTDKQAVAAINGTFFDMRKGGAVVFLKVDGKIISPANPDAPSFIQEAAFAASDDSVFILAKPSKGWESIHQNYQDMMVSGPLLVKDGQRITPDSISFNWTRHPRSAMCLTEDYQLLMVSVDGRHENQAVGMSTFEMVELMEALDCHDAFNLDGGGSTTLWLKEHGVINYPSDNKKFDHLGARKIANGIVITQK